MAQKSNQPDTSSDFEHIATQPARRGRGSSVQSVRFANDEISMVRAAARGLGIPTSEYIREAAVGRALASFTIQKLHVTVSYQSFSEPRDQTDVTAPKGRTLVAT